MSVLAINGGVKLRNKPWMGGAAIIGEEERQRVKEVLDCGILSGFVGKAGPSFLGGKQVKEFEAVVKDYFKVKHVIAINSATAGLHVALGACGINPGDEIIVPPYTMCASATAVIMTNGIPVFADIDSTTFCIDPVSIEKNITSKTKGIVVVQLYGGAANMDAIMAIAKKHNLFIIEDCAQAPGAKYKGQLVGTFGQAGVFSLNQHKTITCGEGGFVLTNDDRLALRMQLMRNHGEAVVHDMQLADIDNMVGFNYRMTELEAAVSIGQFKNLNAWNNHRRELAQHLAKGLSDIKGISVCQVSKDIEHVYFVFPIKINQEQLGLSRDQLVKALVAEGIPCAGGYVKPIYLEPMYQRRIAWGKEGFPFSVGRQVNYAKGICPVCERMYESELMLTAVCRFPHTKEDIDDVISAFHKVITHRGEIK